MTIDASLIHELKTPAGVDKMYLWRAVLRDQLGRPFEYVLDVVSDSRTIPYDKLLGDFVTLTIKHDNPGPRHFHGVVTRFAHRGLRGGYAHYQLTLRPWLWMLKYTRDCRIYQNKTVPEIIQSVFKEKHGISDFKDRLERSDYRKWEYCVQYRETDFDFVSRLMEQEGIYYYFTHSETGHTLVLADALGSHSPVDGERVVPYRPPGEAPVDLEHIDHWELTFDVQPGAVALSDYNFEKPRAKLDAKSTRKRTHPQAQYEVFDYPGEYREAKEGEAYAKVRLEEMQSRHREIWAHGDVRRLATGALFELKDFHRKEENGEYLICSTTIAIESAEIEQFSNEAENVFDVEFECLPSSEPFRAPAITPKPVIAGPQSAVVVGPKGQEIHTDKYGRVKVQFPWDRLGKSDENSSCWIRVSQTWAGKNWGAIHIPRIGQEVLVEFEEGDPDRPIITGRVYNADQMPPYTLPDNQTRSGIISRSTKEGDIKTFNELRFEDKKGEEHIYFHAEKDFERIVENNDTLKVGFDKKDKGDQSIEIFNNQKLIVGCKDAEDGSQTIEIWNNRTETVKEGNEKVTIEKGNREVYINTGNELLQVKKGNRDVNIDKGNDSLTVKMGNHTISVNAGKSTITAAQMIELKVGGSSIQITPTGITLKSTMITLQGQGMVQTKGGMVSVKGNIMVEVNGGMLKLN